VALVVDLLALKFLALGQLSALLPVSVLELAVVRALHHLLQSLRLLPLTKSWYQTYPKT
jgi:hypothetical protein